MPKKLTKNAAQCKVCGVILESKSRHDYQSCEHIAVDGGLDYARRNFLPEHGQDSIIELSEWSDNNEKDTVE